MLHEQSHLRASGICPSPGPNNVASVETVVEYLQALDNFFELALLGRQVRIFKVEGTTLQRMQSGFDYSTLIHARTVLLSSIKLSTAGLHYSGIHCTYSCTTLSPKFCGSFPYS